MGIVKNIVIFLLLIITDVQVFAQTDAVKLKNLERIVKQYQYKDYPKAYSAAREGLTLAQKDKSTKDACRFYELLGNLSRLKNNYDQAFYFFGRELALAEQNNIALQVILAYRDLGLAYQAQSRFPDAQSDFLKALDVSENTRSHPRMALIYDDIASIYDNENQLDKASEYVQKALISRDKRDTLALEKALEIKGAIAYIKGSPEQGRAFHQQALKLYRLQNDSIGEATMYMQIASTYDGSYHNAENCLVYGFKSKAIWDKTNPGNVYALYNLDN